jgi:hypothetical protein
MTNTANAGSGQASGVCLPVGAIAASHCGFQPAALEHHEVPAVGFAAVVFDEPAALQGACGGRFRCWPPLQRWSRYWVRSPGGRGSREA